MILNSYKNRFWLIIGLIFFPKKFHFRLTKYRQDIEDEMQQRFDDKIQMLNYDYMENGLYLREGANNHIDLLQMPMIDIREPILSHSHVQTTTKKIEVMHIAFSNHRVESGYLKQQAAQKLAHRIVEMNMLKSRFDDYGNIIFSINYF